MLRKVAAVGAALTLAGFAVAAEAHAAAGCRVTWTVSNSWPGGFGVSTEITNLGDPVNGWTLTFAFPSGQTISQIWNATQTQSGAQVSVLSVEDAGRYNTLGNHRFIRYNKATSASQTVSTRSVKVDSAVSMSFRP